MTAGILLIAIYLKKLWILMTCSGNNNGPRRIPVIVAIQNIAILVIFQRSKHSGFARNAKHPSVMYR